MSNGGFVDMLRVLGAVQSSGRVQAHFFRIRGAITLQKEEQAEIQLGDVIQYRQKQHHEGNNSIVPTLVETKLCALAWENISRSISVS
ncbi:hypothetical protein TNCV_1880981 [Trichonephila clavipes]|nr:hypothetical protein TNCV_1880981 [Trichonephila clavipes]